MNPADGLTKVRSDMVPLQGLLESGGFCPGQLRTLNGVAWKEEGLRVVRLNSPMHVHGRTAILC